MKRFKVLPKHENETAGYITPTDKKAVKYLIENALLIVSKGCKTAHKYYNVIEANENTYKIKVFDAQKQMSTFTIQIY